MISQGKGLANLANEPRATADLEALAQPKISLAAIKADKVRALAVATANRSEALPSVPTVGESVPGFEASTWQGIGAPQNTPAEIVALLNKEINAGLSDPSIKARLASLGSLPDPMTPAEYESFIARKLRNGAR